METVERSRVSLRLPTRMREWVGSEARANGHSTNAEIIRLIRERMIQTETVGEPVKAAPTV